MRKGQHTGLLFGRSILCGLCLCVVNFPVFAQTAAPLVNVTATLSPPVVPFHKQATLSIVVESPAGVEIKVPDVRDLIGDLKVSGTPEHQKELIEGERVRTTETYLLDPIKIHDYYIRPLELTWGDGGQMTIAMPVFRVRELTSEELVEAQLFEAGLPGGPGVDTGVRQPWWVWAAVAGGVMLVALLALAIWRLRRPAATVVAPKTPWELAKERLALLGARHLPQQGKHDAYYVDLSAILRYYIEARFALHAPERTTPEFLAEALGKGYFSSQQEVFLSRFLRLCDRVKFARFRPDLEEMSRSFEEVLGFVEETVPQPVDETQIPKAAAA